jgi:hypothetical protein
MATTIVTKSGSGAPTASNLVAGELAVDLTNKRLYTENSSGTVLELGTNPASDVTLGDNTKAVFGDGSDLRIYHTGSHSTIENIGTGHLQIHTTDFRLKDSAGTESMILANADGNVQLYYDNAEKLATTATGIDVTGTVTASSTLTAQKLVSANGILELDDNGTHNGIINSPASLIINIDSDANSAGENFIIAKDRTSTSGGTELFRVQEDGNVGIGVVPNGTYSKLQVKAVATSYVADFIGNASGDSQLTFWNSDQTAVVSYIENQAAGAHMSIVAGSGRSLKLGAGGNAGQVLLDASGNLLVGKTVVDSATAGCLLTAGGEAVFTKSGGESLTLNRQTSDGIIVSLRKDNTTVGSIGSISGVVSYINLDPRSGGTGIAGTNTDSIIPVTGTGAVADGTKDLGLTTARWRNLYLSGGVYLGGTGAANLLDDYEEGTWTPVLASDAIAGGYTTQVGKYTKIGNVVNVSFNVQMSSIGSFAGAVVTVTGLPFTAANNACEEIGTVNVKSPASALAGVSYLRVLNNGTEARLEQNSGTTTADHNCNANKIDTGTLLQGSITYLTA